MNEESQLPHADDSDEGIAALLRAAGRRELPSQQLADEVRAAVHEAWLATVNQKRRRQFAKYAVAAGIAAVGVAALIAIHLTRPAGAFAQVARVEGTLKTSSDNSHWQAAKPGDRLTTGMALQTESGTRVALAFDDGVSVRMDAHTLVELDAEDEIAMKSGALYIDVQPDPTSAPLTVKTRYGTVRHVGTQYELRQADDGVEVSVREGRVRIDGASRPIEAALGEQLLLTADGARNRRPVSPQDPRWEWAIGIAPSFDIEHQPLSKFLEWVARETGRRIVYSDDSARSGAEQLLLRGSIGDLPPDQALAAVMATTAMTYENSPAEIRIQAAP